MTRLKLFILGGILLIVISASIFVWRQGYIIKISEFFASDPVRLTSADPISFGAVGDDTTDDGPALQRAIDALVPGGVLTLTTPTKKYAIATEIIITKPITIFGNGWTTIVRAKSSSIASIFLIQGGGDGSTFKNFRLEGAKSGTGGTIQRGIYFNGAKNGTVQNILFSGPVAGTGLNFGVDINGINSGNAQISSNKFERLVASSGNGAAILIEGSTFNQITDNIIDSSEFNNASGAPSAAIFLSAFAGGNGSTDNIITNNIIFNHPQAGISVNSTTYYEFSGNLGACNRNIIANNEIYNSKSVNGGDASSGIVIVGNSSFNRILNNKIHHNGHFGAGGFGIVISGSIKGIEANGQPKMDETPDFNEIVGNRIYNNQDDGIRIKGATNTLIENNEVFDNGQRIHATFRNIYITSIGGKSSGNSTTISKNNLRSSRLAYQIGIGPSVAGTKITNNFYEGGAMGTVNDSGISTINDGGINQENSVVSASFNVPTITPIISNSPNTRLGDLDSDGDIDIFDYNLLINDFGKNGSGIASDIDRNSTVDIFDYNKLIENFGK